MTIYTTNKPSASVRALTVLDTVCSAVLVILAVAFFIGQMIKPVYAEAIDPNYEKTMWVPPLHHSTICTNSDVAIGVAVGAASAVAIGVGTVATSTLVGPGVATGSVVGWSGALSAPFLANSTALAVTTAGVLVAPIVGTVTYYTACVIRDAELVEKAKNLSVHTKVLIESELKKAYAYAGDYAGIALQIIAASEWVKVTKNTFDYFSKDSLSGTMGNDVDFELPAPATLD
jgi:hypothetical protein